MATKNKLTVSIRKNLAKAGVSLMVINAMQGKSIVTELKKYTFSGSIMQGGYYTRIEARGLRNAYGQIETWEDLGVLDKTDFEYEVICHEAILREEEDHRNEYR